MRRMRSLSPVRLFHHDEPDNLQIMFDLHLEVGRQYSTFLISPPAPYLILAGDVGRLSDYEGLICFLAVQWRSFQHVFLVLGNHEFFRVLRREDLDIAQELEQEPILEGKFPVLNRTRTDISDHITVLGCTLQSYILPRDSAVVQKKVKDFREIRGWSIDDHNAEHLLDFI